MNSNNFPKSTRTKVVAALSAVCVVAVIGIAFAFLPAAFSPNTTIADSADTELAKQQSAPSTKAREKSASDDLTGSDSSADSESERVHERQATSNNSTTSETKPSSRSGSRSTAASTNPTQDGADTSSTAHTANVAAGTQPNDTPNSAPQASSAGGTQPQPQPQPQPGDTSDPAPQPQPGDTSDPAPQPQPGDTSENPEAGENPGASERTYDSAVTGAPRAVGRTRATVKQLTDAAETAVAGYSRGDLTAANTSLIPVASASSVPDTVHVTQFGAYGDGIHDDHDALQAAFDSGASIILLEHNARYKSNKSLKLNRSNVTILGNNATLVTDAEYNDSDERFVSITGTMPAASIRDEVVDDWKNQPRYFIHNVGIFQLNFEALEYNPADAPEGKEAYSKQLMVQMASNVDIFDCTFITPHPSEGKTVDGYTALDAYTGWHDITIEGCTVENHCDKEAGGGIWIRDQFNTGASNMLFWRNDLRKTCHDEILAVFNSCSWATDETRRPVVDVLIAENKFKMREDKASSSVMAFTTKYGKNVLIENNEIDVYTNAGLLWSTNSEGVVIRDNDIALTRSVWSGNYLGFRGPIELVENNRITLNALDDSTHGDVYVFANEGTVRGNNVECNMELGYLANVNGSVENNTVRLNAYTHVLFNAASSALSNTVDLHAKTDTYFQYHLTTLTSNATLQGNTIRNHSGAKHTVVMLNDATMNGHTVTFSQNSLTNNPFVNESRILFLKLADTKPQTDCVVFTKNDIPDLQAYGIYSPSTSHTYRVETGSSLQAIELST